MQANRILPDLQCSLLCEDVRQEINGNLILIGVINAIRVPQLPVTAGRLCVFNTWTAGLGQFTESVRLIAPDQTTVLRRGEIKFELKDAAWRSPNVMVFGQVEFKVAGNYYVEVVVDDVMKLRYPIPVVLAQPPPGTTPAPAPAQPQG
jgi:hypothetical protein